MKEIVLLLLCVAVVAGAAHDFGECDPLPDPIAIHPRTKEVMSGGHLAVYREGSDVVADVICDNSQGFFVPSFHKEQLRCSYNNVHGRWQWEHVHRHARIPKIQCTFVYPRPTSHLVDLGTEYEGCATPEATRETLTEVQETIESALPCAMAEECVVSGLACRQRLNGTQLTFRITSVALQKLSDQQAILDTAVEFITSFSHPAFKSNKVRHRSRRDVDADGEGSYVCPGNTVPLNDGCALCPPGSYTEKTFDDETFEVGVEQCVECPYDTYSESEGQLSCASCSDYLPNTGTLMEGSINPTEDCVAVCHAPDPGYQMQSYSEERVAQGTTITMTCNEGYVYGGQGSTEIMCDTKGTTSVPDYSPNFPDGCRKVTLTAAKPAVKAGETATLTCVADVATSDDYTFKWMKGTDPITQGASYTIDETVDSTSKLEIPSFDSDDVATDYDCMLVYDDPLLDEMSAEESLDILDNVMNPDAVTLTVNAGDEIVITCSLNVDSHYTSTSVSWELDSTTITEGTSDSTENDMINYVLTINSASNSDGGEYTCTGTYNNVANDDPIVVAKSVTYKVNYFSLQPSVDDPIITTDDTATTDITLICEVTSDENPSFTWKKDGEAFTAIDDVVNPSSTSTLTLPNAVVNSGSYVCYAEFSGLGTMESTAANVGFYDIGIETDPESTFTDAGDTASLSCTVKVPPDSSITWTVDWKVYDASASTLTAITEDADSDGQADFTIETDTNTGISTLSFPSSTVTGNSGKQYKCLVTYVIDSETEEIISAEATTYVRELRQKLASSVTATTGEDQDFVCEYYGDNHVTSVVWTMDGSPTGVVDSSSDTAAVPDGDYFKWESTYRISGAGLSSVGKVTCTFSFAANMGNPMSSETQFYVMKVDPLEPNTYSNEEAYTVTCTYTGSNDASSVTWYIDTTAVNSADNDDPYTITMDAFGSSTANTRKDYLAISGRTYSDNDQVVKCEYTFNPPVTNPIAATTSTQTTLVFEGMVNNLNPKYYSIGGVVSMECSVGLGLSASGTSRTAPTTTWYSKAVSSVADDYAPVDSTTTEIVNSDTVNSGLYTSTLSIAEGVVATSMALEYKCEFEVTANRKYDSEAELVVRLVTMTPAASNYQPSYVNDGVKLTCTLDASDSKTGVTWTGPDNSVITGDDVSDNSGHEYYLQLIYGASVGNYMCTFTFDEGDEPSGTFEGVTLYQIKMTSNPNMNAVKGTSNQVTISCEAESASKLADLKFELDGADVDPTGTDEPVFNAGKTTITYTYDASTTAGSFEYGCRISGSTTEYSPTTTTINVLDIETPLQSYYYVAEETSKSLFCAADYIQTLNMPTVQWFKQGATSAELSLEGPVEATLAGVDKVSSSYTVLNVVADDDKATYKCKFTYTGLDAGTTLETQGTFIINEVAMDPVTEAAVDGSVDLTCTLTGDPDLNIVWRRGDGSVFDQDGTKYVIDPSGVTNVDYTHDPTTQERKSILRINTLTLEDNDNAIKCFVNENLFKSTNLRVTGIQTDLDPTYQSTGEAVTMVCVLNVGYGGNAPTVQWSRDSTDVEDGSDYSIISDTAPTLEGVFTSTLTVLAANMATTWGGEYKCEFTTTTFPNAPFFSTDGHGELTVRLMTKTPAGSATIWHYDSTNPLQLQCDVADSSSSAATITWTGPDGGNLGDTSTLSLATTGTSGEYKCKYTYGDAPSPLEAVFNVQLHEITMTSVDSIYVTKGAGNTVTISCYVESDQQLALKFYSVTGSTEINPTTGPKWEGGKTKITYVFDAEDEDGVTEYDCRLDSTGATFANTNEKSTTSSTITVMTISTPISASGDGNIYDKSGESQNLKCEADNYHSSLTVPQIQWYKGSEIVQAAADATVDGTDNTKVYGEYSVTFNEDNDRSEYKCVFTYTASELADGGQLESTALLVLSTMEAENAAIIEDVAQQAILRCTITGPSDVNIGWNKRSPTYTDSSPDYTTLSSGVVQGNYDPSSFTRISTLTLDDLETDDTNYYTCFDDTDQDTVQLTEDIVAEITLEVIDVTMDDVQAVTGKSAVLTCSVGSLLDSIVITWFKDTTQITEGINAVALDSDGVQKSELTVTVSDTDTAYTCKATRGSFMAQKIATLYAFEITGAESYYYSPQDPIVITVKGYVEPSIEFKFGDSDADSSTYTTWATGTPAWLNIEDGTYNSPATSEKTFTLTIDMGEFPGFTAQTITGVVLLDGESQTFNLEPIKIYKRGFTTEPVVEALNDDSLPTFNCVAEGEDPSQMTLSWTIGGQTIPSGLSTETPASDTNSRSSALTVTANNEIWNNDLACKVVYTGDDGSTITSTVAINAVGASMAAKTYMNGATGDAVMTCLVWGDDKPFSLTWYDNAHGAKTEIDPDDSRITIYEPASMPVGNSVAGYTLTIADMGFGDEGEYNCDIVFNDGDTAKSLDTDLLKISAVFEPASPYFLDSLAVFKITCTYFGLEDPTAIEWFNGDSDDANNKIISGGETTYTQGTFQYSQRSSIMTFSSVAVTMTGKYTCKWTANTFSPVETIDIAIRTLAVSAAKIYAVNEDLVITCNYAGTESGTMEWYYDNELVSASDSDGITINDGALTGNAQEYTLTISSPHPETNGGKYDCRLSFPDGDKRVESTEAIIRVGSIINREDEVLTEIMVDNGVLSAICKLEAEEVPNEVTWYKDNTELAVDNVNIILNTNTKTLDNSIVYFSNITYKSFTYAEKGDYKCSFTYTDTNNVEPTVEVSEATVTPENECVFVDLSSTTSKTLTCTYTGDNDVASVEFTVPGEDNPVTGTKGTDTGTGPYATPGTYELTGLTEQNSGSYGCTFVTSSGQRVSARFILTARQAVLTNSMESDTPSMLVGTAITLTCTVNSGAKSINWKTASGTLTEDTDYEVINTENEGGLVTSTTVKIDITTSSDNVAYSCEGVYANDFCPTDVTFSSGSTTITTIAAAPTTDLADGYAYGGNSVTLSCVFPNALPSDSHKITWSYNKADSNSLTGMIGNGLVFNDQGGLVIDGVFDTDDTTDSITTTLTIADVDENTAGYYMCMIKWGTVFIKSTVAQITVRYIKTPPVTTNFAKGATATLTCIAYGDDVDQPTVSFYEESDEQTALGDGNTVKAADGAMFTYTRMLSTSDQGSYKCKATWAGSDSGNAESDYVDLIELTVTEVATTVWGVENYGAEFICKSDGVVKTSIDGALKKQANGKNVLTTFGDIQWETSTDNGGSWTAISANDANYEIKSANVNPAGERFSPLLVRQVAAGDSDNTFRCKITYLDGDAVVGGEVTSAVPMTLKVSQINTFTASPVDPITGDNVVLSCEATGETVPTFNFYTANRKILDPTYFTTVTDRAVSTSGTTYTATMTVKAEAPNNLRSGETIYCMADYGAAFGNVDKSVTVTTYFDCADATFRNPGVGTVTAAPTGGQADSDGTITQTIACPDDEDDKKYVFSPTNTNYKETITCTKETGKYDAQLFSCAEVVAFEETNVRARISGIDNTNDLWQACTDGNTHGLDLTGVTNLLKGSDGCGASAGIKCLENNGGCTLDDDGITCQWNEAKGWLTIGVVVQFDPKLWTVTEKTTAIANPRTPSARYKLTDCSNNKKKRSADNIDIVLPYYGNGTSVTVEEQKIVETVSIFKWVAVIGSIAVAAVAAVLFSVHRSRKQEESADVESLMN